MADMRTAIITAAGKGIGAGIARHFAKLGYKLVLLSPGGGAERLAAEIGALGFRGSVTSENDIGRAVELAMKTWGRVDAVVNNSGHAPTGELLTLSDDDWRTGLDLLLLNVVRVARAVTDIMARQGGGSIVNISTYVAEQPDLRFPISSSIRAGLAAFVKLYADQYGSMNVRMNSVLPGTMENRTATAEHLARIPLRRVARIEELAKAVAFLASSEASYITGQSIRVDGGLARGL